MLGQEELFECFLSVLFSVEMPLREMLYIMTQSKLRIAETLELNRFNSLV